MKNRFAISAALVLITGMGLAFAGADVKPAAAQAAPAVQEDPKVKEFKDILFKLVRQDEYLDEAIETLDASNGRLSAHEASAMGLNLKMIGASLNKISAMNKKEFAVIQSGSPLATYTNTILSYSRKVDRKSAKVNVMIAQLAAKNKKTAMRDAVSGRKGAKKGGKKLTQMLEEQNALAALAKDAKVLRASSKDLSATSKWLYIASK